MLLGKHECYLARLFPGFLMNLLFSPGPGDWSTPYAQKREERARATKERAVAGLVLKPRKSRHPQRCLPRSQVTDQHPIQGPCIIMHQNQTVGSEI